MDVRPLDQATLPASVRNAPPETRRVYEQALAFESLLVQQITQSLVSSAQDDGTGDAGTGDAAQDQLRQMLPQTMADAVVGAGGLGLAADLTSAITVPPAATRKDETDR